MVLRIQAIKKLNYFVVVLEHNLGIIPIQEAVNPTACRIINTNLAQALTVLVAIEQNLLIQAVLNWFKVIIQVCCRGVVISLVVGFIEFAIALLLLFGQAGLFLKGSNKLKQRSNPLHFGIYFLLNEGNFFSQNILLHLNLYILLVQNHFPFQLILKISLKVLFFVQNVYFYCGQCIQQQILLVMLFVINSNKYNIKMEQSKSPKSLAYARLGKHQSGKSSNNEQQKKGKRNSTGNIYEQILQQIHPQANSYIRELVHKNEKQSSEPQTNSNFHSRRKSYAEIVIDSSSKERQRVEKVREERQTLCKPKFAVDSAFLQQQITPKNSAIPLNKKSSASKIASSMNQSSNIMINSFKKQAQKREESFLDNLTNYLSDLNQAGESYSKGYNAAQKLSETLKINSGESQSFKLISKLQQSHLKIKELKLKNYYQQKQLNKFHKKQQKMKDSLFQMLGEIKHLNAQLTYEKKERKKLQRIIDSFEMRKNQPQRKTIGKHYNLKLQELSNDFNTEHQYQDSSFRQYTKNATNKRNFNPIKIYDQERNAMQGMLDSQKIQKLFRSNYNSDQSDD